MNPSGMPKLMPLRHGAGQNSEDAILRAFRRQPSFMLRSTDKLNAVMSFWIDRLGWDPSPLLAAPGLFGHSIEKRLAPRASVVQYLLSKVLLKKDASLVTPFGLTDDMFLQKYVMCFEEETSNLLRLLAISDRDTTSLASGTGTGTWSS